MSSDPEHILGNLHKITGKCGVRYSSGLNGDSSNGKAQGYSQSKVNVTSSHEDGVNKQMVAQVWPYNRGKMLSEWSKRASKMTRMTESEP